MRQAFSPSCRIFRKVSRGTSAAPRAASQSSFSSTTPTLRSTSLSHTRCKVFLLGTRKKQRSTLNRTMSRSLQRRRHDELDTSPSVPMLDANPAPHVSRVLPLYHLDPSPDAQALRHAERPSSWLRLVPRAMASRSISRPVGGRPGPHGAG